MVSPSAELFRATGSEAEAERSRIHSSFQFRSLLALPKEYSRQNPRALGYGNISWRGSSVSAELFAETCRKVGFECISQELVNWDTHRYFLLDAFSTFRKAKSGHARVFQNRDFMKQCYELIENARAVIAT
jgi:hypothetical protein